MIIFFLQHVMSPPSPPPPLPHESENRKPPPASPPAPPPAPPPPAAVSYSMTGRLQSDGSPPPEDGPAGARSSGNDDEDDDAMDGVVLVEGVFTAMEEETELYEVEERKEGQELEDLYEEDVEMYPNTSLLRADMIRYCTNGVSFPQGEPSTLTHVEEDALSWAESSENGSQLSLEALSDPFHVSHSSPQFPLGMSGHTPFLMSSLGGRMTGPASVHGTYGKVDMDFNPFASEFQKGPRPEDAISKVPHFSSINGLSASRPPSASCKGLQRSGSLFSPIPRLSPHCSDDIPSKAFQDLGFLQFVKELDREPVLSDYITYRMRVIGDEIEKKYSRELNQAMDEVFYEVVKHSLSWSTFKAVSTKLLVGGARIQDSILLVPCFARRLVDVVPQMGGRIADYTEEVLENYTTGSIFGMGGWVSGCGQMAG